MLLRSTGRLLCPDTLTAKIPMLSNMPHLTTPCSGGGCMHTASQASETNDSFSIDDIGNRHSPGSRSDCTRHPVTPDGLQRKVKASSGAA